MQSLLTLALLSLVTGAAAPAPGDSVRDIRNEFYGALQRGEMPKGDHLQQLVDRCYDLAESSPEPGDQLQALMSIMDFTEFAATEEFDGDWRNVADRLMNDYLDEPALAGAVMGMRPPRRAELRADHDLMMETLASESGVPVVVGTVHYVVAKTLSENDMTRRLSPEQEQELVRRLGVIEEKYAEEEVPNMGKTLGQMASGLRYEFENLRVGKQVPDLQGVDLDGVEFALSDYRGKVIFLDFWAHW